MTEDERDRMIDEYGSKAAAEIERLRSERLAFATESEERKADNARLLRDSAALELECASWKQSSALKLAEIGRLTAPPTAERIEAAAQAIAYHLGYVWGSSGLDHDSLREAARHALETKP